MIELHSYFNPLNSGIYAVKDRWENTQIGQLIDCHTQESFPEITFAEIAILNVSEYEGSKNKSSESDCKVRDAFYRLHCSNFPKIIDLGEFQLMPTRKESFRILEQVCAALIENGTIPIVIGGGNDLAYAVYKAYVSLDKTITLASVDKNLDIGLEEDNLANYSYLGKIIGHKPNHLFHYVNLAYQTYYVSPMAVEMIDNMHFEAFRLGSLKANMQEVEPIMRNTDFLSFDVSAIQHAYAGANVYATPNGLNSEEACKIMRYAGLSDKITAIGMFEYNQSLDQYNQTAQLIAQMIWFFTEGYKQRKNELNPNLKDCIKYTVTFEDGINDIIFYKSKSSGRWWMGVPFKTKNNTQLEKYFVACSYKDYEVANQGDVPERWVKTFRKFL